MINKLKKMIEGIDADYADLRHEAKSIESIRNNNNSIEDLRTSTTEGFVLRVLKNGGFSSVTFYKEEDAEKAIKNAVENAELLGKNSSKPVKLADAPVVKDHVKAKLIEDPRDVSLDEKMAILNEYSKFTFDSEKIIQSNLNYFNLIREKNYVNTEGSEIFEELVTTGISGSLISQEDDLTQNIRISIGGSNGFQNIRNRMDVMKKRKQLVLDLLKATPLKGGTYNCIINPSLTGVFAHEAFGHFSEADIVQGLPAMRKKMEIGNKIGSDIVNILDDATMPNQLGFYKYDDEGVAVRPVELIKDGVLSGRLHSRRTSAEFDEPISGHMIAEDYRYAPIVRMGNIYIKPDENSFEDLLSELQDGLYICDAKGGQTAGENFTFGAQYGYIIENGKIKNMIRDINITGNLYSTLKSIKMIGNDFHLGEAGGCGKGQTNIRSCHGGPHILIENLVVGGL